MPGTSTSKDLNTIGKAAASAAISILEQSGDVTSNRDWDWVGPSQLNFNRKDGCLIQVIISKGHTSVLNDTHHSRPIVANLTGVITADANTIAQLMLMV